MRASWKGSRGRGVEGSRKKGSRGPGPRECTRRDQPVVGWVESSEPTATSSQDGGFLRRLSSGTCHLEPVIWNLSSGTCHRSRFLRLEEAAAGGDRLWEVAGGLLAQRGQFLDLADDLVAEVVEGEAAGRVGPGAGLAAGRRGGQQALREGAVGFGRGSARWGRRWRRRTGSRRGGTGCGPSRRGRGDEPSGVPSWAASSRRITRQPVAATSASSSVSAAAGMAWAGGASPCGPASVPTK